MKTFKEFPSIAIPEFMQIDGWEDASWHNDVTANAQLPLPAGDGIVVWVAEDNPTQREWPATAKFLVEYHRTIHQWDENGRVVMYEGESEKEAEVAASDLMLRALYALRLAPTITDPAEIDQYINARKAELGLPTS